MARALKTIGEALLSLAFIMFMATVIAGIMFVILVILFYYTITLFLEYGILAGAAAIVTVGALLFIATYKLIKRIQKG